jgi:hypothetical protein
MGYLDTYAKEVLRAYSMGYLDTYAKEVLRAIASEAFVYNGPSVLVNYGDGRPCRIDGTVGGSHRSRSGTGYAKQVRGAVLDLLVHPYPKHMYDSATCAYQCKLAFGHFLAPERFRVVVLNETHTNGNLDADTKLVRSALSDLGFRRLLDASPRRDAAERGDGSSPF